MAENKEMKETQKEEVKNVTLGLVLGWLFGGFFLLSGFLFLFTSFVTGVLCLLIGVLVFPPANKFLVKKFNFSLSKGLRIVIVIVLLALIGILGGGEMEDELEVSKDTEETIVSDAEEVPEEIEEEVVVEETEDWVKVASINASADKQSDTFALQGGKQKVVYTLSGVEPILCIIYVEKEGKDIMVDGGFPIVTISEPMEDETMMRKNKGEYYIDIRVANGTCMADVYEYR